MALLACGRAMSAPASKYNEPFPRAASKKGLQVQMVDDALALGIKHAALNFDLASLIRLKPEPESESATADGQTFYFNPGYLRAMDSQIKMLSDAEVVVSLILLCYKPADPELQRVLLHPRCAPNAPNRLSAFNTSTPEGIASFKATMEFLAERYSRPDRRFGRAVNYIVGNEVNSHWEWYNMGPVSMSDFVDDYLRTVRLCHEAVRKMSSSARVYLSMEHHWNIPYQSDPMKGFAGKPFLALFNERARAGGNFDWHLAFHPYPENLFEPRVWNDKTATFDENTKRITFKNLEMLTQFLGQETYLYEGKPRRVILSEQGLNMPEKPEGELWQAAGYCYAYYKADQLDGIDSFILHRHVDHGHEGGLNLGLWSRDKTSSNPARPLAKKRIYEVFRAADTPQWEEAFKFALPVIGITNWSEIMKAPAP